MWQPNSWRNFTAKHIPEYPDKDHLSEVEKTLVFQNTLTRTIYLKLKKRLEIFRHSFLQVKSVR